MTKTKPEPIEPTSDLTENEFYDTVTGEERGLINRVYKRPLARMAQDDPELFVEVLVFLDMHRRREPDPQARAHAMTNGQLRSYFATADADEEEDEDAGEA